VRTALVVSRTFPVDERTAWGTVLRLETQLEALARLVDRIECLLLISETWQFSPQELQAHQERLRRRWSAKLSVQLAPVVRHRPERNRWERYVSGVFDFRAQQAADGVGTEAALRAVHSAMRGAPDLILAHRLPAMSLLLRLSRHIARTPVVFDLDDVEHIAHGRRLLRYPHWPMERLLLLQMPRLLLTEIQAVRRSRLTFVCSRRDRRHLARLTGSRHIEVVENSIRIPPTARAGAIEPVVLFLGAMGYSPNARAADTLVQDIWPIVRSRVPEARLIIAGSRPELLKSFSGAHESVTFSGFVDDLATLYAQARVVCCPIFYGSGTRIKIIEAAAHARAIVSTRLGAEGLVFEDGIEIVLRDDVPTLAEECIRLLQDTAAAERLGAAARERARAVYDRSAVVDRLEGLFNGVLRPGDGAGQPGARAGNPEAGMPL
jgi:glycosyltransferase involved in cell wall biosynthesis